MDWDWEYALAVLPRLLEGLAITLQATVLAAVIALAIGLLFALGRRAGSRPVQLICYWTMEFIRRTPLLVQLYLIFFILPRFGIALPAMVAGVIALGLHTGAYMSEVFRAGIDGVPAGQWEAARALNIPTARVWRYIILPQALPPMIPAAGNYVLMLFKETALLSTITVIDVMGAARIAGNETYRYLEPITLVGLIYLAISLPAAMALRWLEGRIEMSGR